MANTDVVHIDEQAQAEFNRAANLAYDNSVPDHVFWDVTRCNRRAILKHYGTSTIAQQVVAAIKAWTDSDSNPNHPYGVY